MMISSLCFTHRDFPKFSKYFDDTMQCSVFAKSFSHFKHLMFYMSVYVSKIWFCEICTSLYSDFIYIFHNVCPVLCAQMMNLYSKTLCSFPLCLLFGTKSESDRSTLSSTTQSRIKSVQLTCVEATAFVLQRLQLFRQPGRRLQNLLFHSDIIMGNCIQIWKPTESWNFRPQSILVVELRKNKESWWQSSLLLFWTKSYWFIRKRLITIQSVFSDFFNNTGKQF